MGTCLFSGRVGEEARVLLRSWKKTDLGTGAVLVASKGPGLVNWRSIWSDDHTGFLDAKENIKQLDMKGRLLMLDGLAFTQPTFLSWVLSTSCSWVSFLHERSKSCSRLRWDNFQGVRDCGFWSFFWFRSWKIFCYFKTIGNFSDPRKPSDGTGVLSR